MQRELHDSLFKDVGEINTKNKKKQSNFTPQFTPMNNMGAMNAINMLDYDQKGNKRIPELDSSKSIIIPNHVFLDDNFNFYLPVDRAIRVISAIFNSTGMNHDLQKNYFIQLELQAHILNKAGAEIHHYFNFIYFYIFYFCSVLHSLFYLLFSDFFETVFQVICGLFFEHFNVFFHYFYHLHRALSSISL